MEDSFECVVTRTSARALGVSSPDLDFWRISNLCGQYWILTCFPYPSRSAPRVVRDHFPPYLNSRDKIVLFPPSLARPEGKRDTGPSGDTTPRRVLVYGKRLWRPSYLLAVTKFNSYPNLLMWRRIVAFSPFQPISFEQVFMNRACRGPPLARLGLAANSG